MIKTIFITSFHPHISRNILQTGVFSLLKDRADLNIVLLVPDYKAEYFQKNFSGRNVTVEGVPLYRSSKTKTGLFFKKFAEVLMPSETRAIKQKHKLFRDGKGVHYLFFLASNAVGRSLLMRRLIRFADLKLSPNGNFYGLIEKYKPDAIFSTDLHNESDVSLMQDAKRKGISIIGMFRSWDNPTQSILRVFPDKLMAGSNAIAGETKYWQGYPEEKIMLTGHPHYDKYIKGPTKTKEEFFKEFGLDPKKRLILFTPLGDKFVRVNDIDQYALESLKSLPANEVQILVRFPPDESVSLKNFEKPENMFFHRPGHAFTDKFEDREIRKEDDDSLVNEIYWSDLVITGPTSINLDAAFFDKPVIAAHLIPSKRAYFDTVYCFDFSHIAKVLATGGVRYIRNQAELISAISEYLKEPAKDAVGRAKIRQMWFSHADGSSGARVFKEIFGI